MSESPRTLQTALLTRMLSLNQPSSSSSSTHLAPSLLSSTASSTPVWKVLLYDTVALDILSPLLSVAQLRQLGVTLHLSITSQRDSIADTPAIYFIQPSQHNFDLLLNDLQRNLYASFHIFLVSSVSRIQLEYLCQGVLSRGIQLNTSRLTIYDAYSHFICLEDNLLTFTHSTTTSHANVSSHTTPSYTILNDPSSADTLIDSLISNQVDHLFSLCVTLNAIPVLRASKGGAAEMIAQRLDEKLRAQLAQRKNLFNSQQINDTSLLTSLSTTRPLLLLFDRSLDLSAALTHCWTYQALLADLMGLERNRVTVETGSNKKTTYDLSTADDPFWRKHCGSAFPTVAAAVQERLEAYQAEMKRIQAKGVVVGADGNIDDSASVNQHLSETISALPKLQRKKRILDQHTNIATQLLQCIKQRDIDKFVEMEQAFLAKTSLDKDTILKLITVSDENKGTLRDRLRAVILWWLSQQSHVGDDVVNQLRNELTNVLNTATQSNAVCSNLSDIYALDYIRNYKYLHKLSTESVAAAAISVDSGDNKGWTMLGKLAKEVYTTTSGVLAGVRQLLPSSGDLLLTRHLEHVMFNKECEAEQFIYLDPRASTKGPLKRTHPSRQHAQNFSTAYVYVIGGGSYTEYQNLQDWVKKQNGQTETTTAVQQPIVNNKVQRVVYVASEMQSPEQFLKQLSALGEGEKAKKANLPVD